MMNQTGFVLIHGFGGNPTELAPLADELRAKGYPVLCPTLKGHTGIRRDLTKVTYQDWVASAEAVFHEMRYQTGRVVLVGFSMGALIAVNLAAVYPVNGLVTINTPIYYWDLKKITANIFTDIKQRKLSHIQRYLASSAKLPLQALFNFHVFLNHSKTLIPKVQCPIFILQGLDDDAVQAKSAHYLYANIGSAQKRISYYRESGHLMLHSPAAGRAIEDIELFIRELDI